MTRQNKRTSRRSRTEVRLLLLAVAVICVLAFVPAMGTADHTDDHTRAIDSDNVTITLGDDTPGATTTHDWTVQVSEEFGEVDEIILKYSDKDSQFDDEIDADDLVEGNINVVGGGALDVDLVRYWGGDILFRINESYLAAGDTIEIAWSNEVFTNPPETGTEPISLEMEDFDGDYYGSGGDSVFIPGEIEVTDLEVTNPDSNQLSEYQFEFSVEDHPIDNLWRIRADFSDAYEDGLDFDDMDYDTDDIWFEDADGNDLDPRLDGTVYGTEDVLEFNIDPDRLETDAGDGPYTFGFKNITNPDPGTDYDVEIRIDDRLTSTGPMAADNATFDTVESPTMSIEDTNLTHSTTYDPGTYQIDVEFGTANADNVDGFAVEFIDAGDIDAGDLTAADVDVTGADVDTVTTDTDEVKVELADPVTYQENEQATIVLDGVTNPSEIGDFDVAVEFFVNGYNYGNDTLADAFTIEPSLVVGDWESSRSVPSGSLSPNSFTVENVGEVDLTGVRVYLGADSEADAFEKPASFSAIVESWSDETIDAGETKVYEYDLVTEDYFGIDENYEKGEEFYHGPAAGFSLWGVFDQENADPQPFYISESDDSGSIAVSVENETGHPVEGAQVDLYHNEVAPENLVASEESADSTVTFDESHPDIDEGLALGTEEAEAVEYVVVADKDGHEEGTQPTALYEGNHETSEEVILTEIEPATFELSNVLVSSTDLETGEEFFVSTNVTNTGEEFDVETVRLKLDGEEVTNESVVLDPGERTTVHLVADAPDDAGEYNLTVETTDDLFSETINVTEPKPATFEITRFDLFSTELDTGEEFLIIANVTNVGEEFGVDTARLKFDGVEVTNESVALEPGERETVSFVVDAPEDPGEYTASVETADDQAAGEITVGPKFQVLDADMRTDIEQGWNVTVEATIENVGSSGTQQVNFTAYASEVYDDDDGDDDTSIVDRVAVVDDPGNTSQGEALVDVLDEEFETVDLVTNDNVLDEMGGYEVIVVYRFDSDSLAADFLDELDDDQGVVYLDDHQVDIDSESWADGVLRLHNVRNDPSDWESVFLGVDTNPAEVTITADHPIFDGVGEVGETVVLNEDTSTWGSLFGDYSGDVIGEVDYSPSETGEYEGPGIGVNDDENEVLLNALSYDLFSAPDDITEAGAAVLINSVEHVGAQASDGTAAHVTVADEDDEFPFFGEVVIHVYDDITLDAGETATIELEYEVPENLAPDRYTQELSTESDSVISELWVELHADIEVSSYSLDPDPAEEDLAVGETLTAEAVVANHGERAGEFEVEYIVDEDVVANETVEVDADTVETVELDHELREAGTKIISVNGVDPVQIFVESDPDPDPDPDPEPDPDPDPEPDPDPDPDPDSETDVSVNSTAANTSVSVSNANAGEPVSIPVTRDVGEDGLTLDGIDVTPSVDSDFDLTVEAVEPSEDIDSLPNGAAGLLALDIESSLDNDDIEEASFEFTVPQTVLDDRNLDPTAVTMFHNVDGEWTERETELVEENGHVRFRAETPHFSRFVLAGNQPSLGILDYSLSATELSVGEELLVEVDIENTGGVAGTMAVELVVDDHTVTAQTVTVESGEQTVVELVTLFDESGEFQLGVNDEARTTLVVEADDEGHDDDSTGESEDETDDSVDETDEESEQEDDSDGFGSGFGLLIAVAGLVVVCAQLYRRAHTVTETGP